METKYKHWHLNTDESAIAWLHADKNGESTNSLSQEMLDELGTIVTELERESPRGLIILSDKKNGFIAGADINVLAQAKDTAEAAAFIRHGQDIFNRIERLRFPTVCLIHGFAMGGGLELALACRYRVAVEDPSTKVGLPEIKLGIHPGFGGVLRLPPLIGAPAAMDLMLTGRAVNARTAKRLGIIDYAVPQRHLFKAAVDIVNTKPAKRKLAWWKSLTNQRMVRRVLASILRKQVAKKAPRRHYPAPYALIDLWEKHTGNRNSMLVGEETSLSRLVVGKTAQNLIRVFFLQDKLKNIGDKSVFAPKRVHVIGGGVMGGDIAAWCALQGFSVTLQDRHEKNIARVIKNANKLFAKKLKDRILIQAALDRLIPDMHGLGLQHADVVIEAIFEDKAAKQALFKSIEANAKPEALLATNTSSIPLREISEVLTDPSRLVGIHFFNPVAMMQLVEIVEDETTSKDVIAKANAFTRHISRLPLPVKSSPGFLVNRVLMPYLVEAVVLESEGVAPSVIDEAAVDFGMPMGPIALADTVGLDICKSVAENLAAVTSMEVPERLVSLVKAGHLGKKTGKGFYSYKNGKPKHNKPGKNEFRPDDIQDRLMLRMVNEVVACLREGVVDHEDLIDAGIIFGTGFAPFRGGPMHYRNSRGVSSLHKRLSELQIKYGDRFKPDAGWPAQPGSSEQAAPKDNQPNNNPVVREYAGNES